MLVRSPKEDLSTPGSGHTPGHTLHPTCPQPFPSLGPGPPTTASPAELSKAAGLATTAATRGLRASGTGEHLPGLLSRQGPQQPTAEQWPHPPRGVPGRTFRCSEAQRPRQMQHPNPETSSGQYAHAFRPAKTQALRPSTRSCASPLPGAGTWGSRSPPEESGPVSLQGTASMSVQPELHAQP